MQCIERFIGREAEAAAGEIGEYEEETEEGEDEDESEGEGVRAATGKPRQRRVKGKNLVLNRY